MFIDNAKIFVKAGDGGNGIVSFHREKYISKGGPDGGDGGRGGDVILLVDESERTLLNLRNKKHYTADSGKNGGASNCSGRSGENLTIKVPPGTIVKDAETGRIIVDLITPGQTHIIAKGGKGGAGNQHFATSARQAPNFAKRGELGEKRWITLELKLLAEVGLIGYPNVGKSTLLSVISAARPKIADYPFTTLEPNLGVVSIDYDTSFVVADIPGIIENAHEGVGLGHRFLKHAERTKILIHIVDVAKVDGRDPIEDFEIINEELKQYNEKFASKPQIIVANKIDILTSDENLNEFENYINSKGLKLFKISAVSSIGVKDLMFYVAEKLKEIPDNILFDDGQEVVEYAVKEEVPFTIKKEENLYIIEGDWIKKILSNVNLQDYESLQYFQRTLKNKGVIDELEHLGINEGDTVKIDDVEFEYFK